MPQTRSAVTFDPVHLAATARSILAYPGEARLVVEGVAHALEGAGVLGLEDVSGEPTFACLPESALAQAAGSRSSALLTLTSGLGEPGSTERASTVTFAGRLETRERQDCPCCNEVRDVVVLELNFVLLSRPPVGPGADRLPEQQFRVPLEQFRSPEHLLNRGYLRRAVEHANQCHQEELRRAVSRRTQSPRGDIAAVALADLHRDRVEVQWVDPTGAHTAVHEFGRAATTAEELGRSLRRALDTRLC